VNEPIPEPLDPELTTSSLVHELRQPLFVLRGRLQLLRESGAPLDGEALGELLDQLDHMGSLLELYGRPPGEPVLAAPFDVRSGVDQALALISARANAAGVVIHADQPSGSVWINGHSAALRQVLVNLLKNAIDAVSPARVREIVVRVTVHDARVEIAIEDSGEGVPDEVRPRLFEPFVTSKPPGEGTGLGLFITRRHVEELGGRVTIEPGDGGGAHARVVLPRVSDSPAGTPGSSGT